MSRWLAVPFALTVSVGTCWFIVRPTLHHAHVEPVERVILICLWLCVVFSRAYEAVE